MGWLGRKSESGEFLDFFVVVIWNFSRSSILRWILELIMIVMVDWSLRGSCWAFSNQDVYRYSCVGIVVIARLGRQLMNRE